MQTHRIFTVAAPTLPFTLRQVAQACASFFMVLSTGVAMAQDGKPVPVKQLKEVTIQATAIRPDSLPAVAPGGKVAKGARLGVLGNVGIMDAPFNVISYTAEGIADQQAQTIGAVLKSDPSVRSSTNEGHIVENFVIRGFGLSSSSMAINGVYGLAPEQNTPTEIFERVEVLKGPGAMMMGLPPSGDVGGAINLVPKRAGKDPITRVTTTWSSKSNVGVHVDVARRLGEEQRFGVRVNGAVSDGETWLNGQTKAREIGHIALDYQGDDWSAELDVYSLSNKNRKGSPMQPVLTGWKSAPPAPDGSTNFFYGDGVYSNTKTEGLVLRGQMKISQDWSAFASGGTAQHAYDGFIFGTRPVWAVANAATGKATGTAYNSWGEYTTNTAEVGLRGNFATGSVSHMLTMSANVLNYRGGSRGNGTAAINSNIFNPTPITMPAGAAASTFALANDDVMTGLSAVDTLAFAGDRVLLTLGLRHQEVNQTLKNYKESALTPMVGVVFKPWDEDVSLYANYVEGLSPGITVGTTYANAGETFVPYKSKQMEAGVKWAKGDLTQTVSVFQISKPSVVTENNYQRLNGQQRNYGVEWGVSGKVSENVSILGGAVYTKAIQEQTANGVNQGNGQIGVPAVTVNLGVEWALPAVQGLALNARVNHTGRQWMGADNSAELPAWTTLDLGGRYSTRLGKTPVVLRAAMTNVTNLAYWDGLWGEGRVNLGAPRALRVSATFDF